MGLPENIDALLVKHDMTQDALARIAGVAPSSVTRWRHGAQIRNEPLDRLCKYFNLDRDDLLSDSAGIAVKEHGGDSLSPDERELLGCYRSCTPERQDALLNLARDSALLSGGAAERVGVSEAV